MKDSLERIVALARNFTDKEKLDKDPNELLGYILNYLKLRGYTAEKVTKMDGDNFLNLQINITKSLREKFVSGRLVKGLYEVEDMFKRQENYNEIGIDKYIKNHIDNFKLSEDKLRNMDSGDYQKVRHDIYRGLKRVFCAVSP